MHRRTALICLALALVTLAAYANHFQNGFHFDDFHTVTGNPWIRDLANVRRFFTDATTFSTMPDHATYRPVTSLTLVLDYTLARGFKPEYFHLSTFLWFVALVLVLFLLFRRIMDLADPHPSNLWVAAAAAACYGLHPVNAETVNYIVQRADLLATAGAAISLLWFAAWPAKRRYGWYLIPLVVGFLAKPPNTAWPFLLVFVFLFEQQGALELAHWPENRRKWIAAFRATLPALLATVVLMLLVKVMTPPTFVAGAPSALTYWLTQPWVALHYFKSFFLPTELSADTDWTTVASGFSTEAVTGYVFVAALLAAAFRTSRQSETRPVAFGILWFFLAMAPTSVIPLSEVTNDHRMFFPLVGLALAVFWAARLWLFRRTARLTVHLAWARAACAAVAIALLAAGIGTHIRNQVWQSEETLWKDVAEKSPRNGRGLMNYGLVFTARGDYGTAMSYFERAKAFVPSYWPLETNMGVATAGQHLDVEAERHFLEGILLAPSVADPYFYYGRWLNSVGRVNDATLRLETAVRLNPMAFDARHVLMDVYAARKDWASLDRLAADTLRIAPDDTAARRFENTRDKRQGAAVALDPLEGINPTPENLLDVSMQLYQARRFEECIQVAKKALELKPDFAEAYNNIAAAYNSIGKWDEGIQAASQAVKLKPDFQLAKNNLAWAIGQKAKGAH